MYLNNVWPTPSTQIDRQSLWVYRIIKHASYTFQRKATSFTKDNWFSFLFYSRNTFRYVFVLSRLFMKSWPVFREQKFLFYSSYHLMMDFKRTSVWLTVHRTPTLFDLTIHFTGYALNLTAYSPKWLLSVV